MSDDRVIVHEIDIALVLKSAKPGYDAIILDVDNGPDGLTRKENDRLCCYR